MKIKDRYISMEHNRELRALKYTVKLVLTRVPSPFNVGRMFSSTNDAGITGYAQI